MINSNTSAPKGTTVGFSIGTSFFKGTYIGCTKKYCIVDVLGRKVFVKMIREWPWK